MTLGQIRYEQDPGNIEVNDQSRTMLILRCKYQIYCSCGSHIDIIYSEPTTLEFPFTGSLARKGQNPKSQNICEKVASSLSPRPRG